MRKIFLFLAFVLTVSVANAWVSRGEEGIVILATKYMTPQAKSVFESYLGTTYSDDVQHLYSLEKQGKATNTKEIHYVHLDSNLQPVDVEGDDALKALEASLEVVKNRTSHSKDEVVKALRTIINLMCDIHTISHFRIEGVAHSQDDFRFYRRRRDYGEDMKEKVPLKWEQLWNAHFGLRHKGFSPAFYAEDMGLYFGEKFAEYSQGTLRDWVVESGAKSASYLARFTPECLISCLAYNELDDVNYDMMGRASFRLAALLNATIK